MCVLSVDVQRAFSTKSRAAKTTLDVYSVDFERIPSPSCTSNCFNENTPSLIHHFFDTVRVERIYVNINKLRNSSCSLDKDKKKYELRKLFLLLIISSSRDPWY